VIFIYSPKIAEDLIPVLYRIGKKERRPMTSIVDGFLRNSISSYLSNIDRADEGAPRADWCSKTDYVNNERNADKPPAKMSADNSAYRSTLAADSPIKSIEDQEGLPLKKR